MPVLDIGNNPIKDMRFCMSFCHKGYRIIDRTAFDEEVLVLRANSPISSHNVLTKRVSISKAIEWIERKDNGLLDHYEITKVLPSETLLEEALRRIPLLTSQKTVASEIKRKICNRHEGVQDNFNELGYRLLMTILHFARQHTELYDRDFYEVELYGKDPITAITDVTISHSKMAFRVKAKVINGDIITVRSFIVPFALLKDPEAYRIEREKVVMNNLTGVNGVIE